MTSLRAVVALLAVSLALVLQTTVFPHVAWYGVVPNLVLLVVVGCALAQGSQLGMVVGFGAGVLLDLAPPADHVAGRWALALMLVGYVAGRVRQEARPPALAVVGIVAACSFLGSSVFALSGLLLGDGGLTVVDLLRAVLVGVVWDVALTPFVLPLVLRVLGRLEPERQRVLA